MTIERDFGLLISFVLPGFMVLLGLAEHSILLQQWIGTSVPGSPTLGGFLYLTVASIFAGLVVSTIRWLTVDWLHHLTGLRQPDWNFTRLANREQGFGVLINIHYRYYQFYANSSVAVAVFLSARWTAVGFSGWEALVGVGLCLLFLAGSRDTLRKYYRRVDDLLSTA